MGERKKEEEREGEGKFESGKEEKREGREEKDEGKRKEKEFCARKVEWNVILPPYTLLCATVK